MCEKKMAFWISEKISGKYNFLENFLNYLCIFVFFLLLKINDCLYF